MKNFFHNSYFNVVQYKGENRMKINAKRVVLGGPRHAQITSHRKS